MNTTYVPGDGEAIWMRGAEPSVLQRWQLCLAAEHLPAPQMQDLISSNLHPLYTTSIAYNIEVVRSLKALISLPSLEKKGQEALRWHW